MPAIFLYEPRMLPRAVVGQLMENQNAAFQSHQTLPSFIENVSTHTSDNKVLLIGIAGSGLALSDLLRFIRRVKSAKVKILAWVPEGYPWMHKLLDAIYVGESLFEESLPDGLLPALRVLEGTQSKVIRQRITHKRPSRITLTEMEILLQFASGLSSRQMAEKRECSYKTIFSWKHNICEALAIDSHAHWLEMLTEIVQLSSMYQTEKNYGPL